MKTKDFIKMLQEADPSGEGYIRMPGGFPRYAEAKEGYWDGSYSYLDEKGNFVTTTQGYKVDIHCMDIHDFVEEEFDSKEMDNWEDIKSKLKFDFSSSVKSQQDEKTLIIINRAKKMFDDLVKIYKEIKNGY